MKQLSVLWNFISSGVGLEGHEELFKILLVLFFKPDIVGIAHQHCMVAPVELIVSKHLLYHCENCQGCVCGLHSLFPPWVPV